MAANPRQVAVATGSIRRLCRSDRRRRRRRWPARARRGRSRAVPRPGGAHAGARPAATREHGAEEAEGRRPWPDPVAVITATRPAPARACRHRRRAARASPASGIGRAIRKPWANPQPKPHSAASCAGVSTPSATTSRPSARADADDRLAERPALRVAVDPADQRPVQPEDVDRQPGQVGQRRGAAAEAVEGDVHAHEPQAGDVEAGALVVGHDGGRVDLEDQPLREPGPSARSACSTSLTSAPVAR